MMDESSDKPVEMEVEKAMEGTDPKIDEFPEADRGIPTEPTKLDCFVCEYDHEEGDCPVLDWTAGQPMSRYHDLKPKRPEPAFRCAVCGSDPEKDGKCSHVSWIPNWVHQESGPSGQYHNKRCTHCHQFGHWEKNCPETEYFQRPRGVKPDAEHVPEVPGGVKHDSAQVLDVPGGVNHGDAAVLKFYETVKANPSQVPEYIPPFSQLEIPTQPAKFRCIICGIVPAEEGKCPHVSCSRGGQYANKFCCHCFCFGHSSRNCPRKTTVKGVGGLGPAGDKQQVPLFGNRAQFREGGFMRKSMIDPFANGSGAGTIESVHIRMQLQQNGRKSLTTVQGLKKDSWYNKMIKDLEEFCHCNGTVVVQDPEQGQVIQLDGDQRKYASTFLIQAGLVEKDNIKIHGF